MSAIVKLIPVDKKLHAALLYKWRKNPEIHRFMYSTGPETLEDHLSWFDRIANDVSHIRFIVEQGGKPVGTTAFVSIDTCHQRSDFEMYIGEPQARILGAGAIAEMQMLNYGFYELNLHKISCEVFSENDLAIRLHARMGFSQEGVLRDHALSPTGWVNVTRLSILESEWKTARQKLFQSVKSLIPPSSSFET